MPQTDNIDAKKCLEGIRKIIAQWAKKNEIHPSEFVTLREEIGRLEYLQRPRYGWEISIPKPINPVCAEPGCKAGWQAGLLNHASEKFDPVWYCQKHQKPSTSIDPETGATRMHFIPGSPHTILDMQLKNAIETSKRWNAYVAKLIAEKQSTIDRES